MKIKAGLLSHKVGEQYVTVASGEAGDVFCGMLRSNETVMEMLRMLEQKTTEEQLVDGLFAKYDAPRDTIAAHVHRVLEQLRATGLLDE